MADREDMRSAEASSGRTLQKVKGRSSRSKRGSKDLEMLVARDAKARVAISASEALKGLEGLVGIGISFLYDQKLSRFVVKNVSQYGPAYQVLEKGDILVSVDGINLQNKTSGQVSKLILGEEDTNIELVVRDRTESSERLVELKRRAPREDTAWKPTIQVKRSDSDYDAGPSDSEPPSPYLASATSPHYSINNTEIPALIDSLSLSNPPSSSSSYVPASAPRTLESLPEVASPKSDRSSQSAHSQPSTVSADSRNPAASPVPLAGPSTTSVLGPLSVQPPAFRPPAPPQPVPTPDYPVAANMVGVAVGSQHPASTGQDLYASSYGTAPQSGADAQWEMHQASRQTQAKYRVLLDGRIHRRMREEEWSHNAIPEEAPLDDPAASDLYRSSPGSLREGDQGLRTSLDASSLQRQLGQMQPGAAAGRGVSAEERVRQYDTAAWQQLQREMIATKSQHQSQGPGHSQGQGPGHNQGQGQGGFQGGAGVVSRKMHAASVDQQLRSSFDSRIWQEQMRGQVGEQAAGGIGGSFDEASGGLYQTQGEGGQPGMLQAKQAQMELLYQKQMQIQALQHKMMQQQLELDRLQRQRADDTHTDPPGLTSLQQPAPAPDLPQRPLGHQLSSQQAPAQQQIQANRHPAAQPAPSPAPVATPSRQAAPAGTTAVAPQPAVPSSVPRASPAQDSVQVLRPQSTPQASAQPAPSWPTSTVPQQQPVSKQPAGMSSLPAQQMRPGSQPQTHMDPYVRVGPTSAQQGFYGRPHQSFPLQPTPSLYSSMSAIPVSQPFHVGQAQPMQMPAMGVQSRITTQHVPTSMSMGVYAPASSGGQQAQISAPTGEVAIITARLRDLLRE